MTDWQTREEKAFAEALEKDAASTGFAPLDLSAHLRADPPPRRRVTWQRWLPAAAALVIAVPLAVVVLNQVPTGVSSGVGATRRPGQRPSRSPAPQAPATPRTTPAQPRRPVPVTGAPEVPRFPASATPRCSTSSCRFLLSGATTSPFSRTGAWAFQPALRRSLT